MRLSQLEGKPEILPMPDCFSVGEVQVETMEGNHPNRSMILKLSFGKKSLVYATDYEHKEPSFSRLIQFAKNADLLMYDAQFTEAQYPSRRGFGHSTAKKGMELMRRSKAKRLLLIHHAPGSTDALLSRREKKIQNDNVSYAREGQVILI
jgi:ribonuclease BN (tRNA processing enzyme)